MQGEVEGTYSVTPFCPMRPGAGHLDASPLSMVLKNALFLITGRGSMAPKDKIKQPRTKIQGLRKPA